MNSQPLWGNMMTTWLESLLHSTTWTSITLNHVEGKTFELELNQDNSLCFVVLLHRTSLRRFLNLLGIKGLPLALSLYFQTSDQSWRISSPSPSAQCQRI